LSSLEKNVNEITEDEPSDPKSPRPSTIQEPLNSFLNTSNPPVTVTTPPSIDYKVDFKIDISSGKCVLHAGPPIINGPTVDGTNGGNANNPQNEMNHQQNNNNSNNDEDIVRNTNFIFPAIKMKVFYEPSSSFPPQTNIKMEQLSSKVKKAINEHQKKTKKIDNLYVLVKLESLLMPSSYTSHMINRDFFNSRDMCISPALLDFLEQTLEPYDQIKASFENATSPVILNKLTKSKKTNFHLNYLESDDNTNANGGGGSGGDDDDDDTSAELSDISDRSSSSSSSTTRNGINDTVIIKDSKKMEKEEEEEEGEAVLTQDNKSIINTGGTDTAATAATSSSSSSSSFPLDVVVFVSMLPSSIRFTCQPQSTMECLLKLPTLEMVFSNNRIEPNRRDYIERRLNGNLNLFKFYSTKKNSIFIF
jgi:predicted transcriptional regulator